METRTCTKCGQEKPLSAFAKQKLGKFGRRASCLECGKKANRAAYVAAHPTAKIGPSPHSGMTASERQALYEKRHPEVKTMKYRRARERLSGSYVRGLLADSFGVQRTLISDDVVELKRAQLSVMRQTKQLVQTIKEKQDERN
ncbi:hypothetical protein [Propionivibrio sp.]|uniref:hypothetical protein n=1 Tax=Propionivibrio sp. TaxID=2212460 RepID=UPI0025EC9A67|nr:hypothetical protein [Propionivibrio sp.]